MAEIDQPRRASAWASTSSPCVSIGRGSSDAAAPTPAASGGALPVVGPGPSARPAPGAQTSGDSMISSGEIPAIGDSDETRAATEVERLLRSPRHALLVAITAMLWVAVVFVMVVKPDPF